MSKPIIVALDPEHEDDAPLVAGTALAAVTGAPLLVVGAYLHDPITNAVSAGTVDADQRAQTLRNLEARTQRADVADLIVMGGPSAARVLHDAAVSYDAAVLVVGSSRRGVIGRAAPGTTADRLLHGSPCPVVVTPSALAPGWRPRRIGAGFLDLDDGHEALRVAAALARASDGSLRAITAVEPMSWSRSAAVAPYGAGGADEARSIAEQELEAAIAALPPGSEVAREVVVAHAADALAKRTSELDLLVCGSRGYGPLRAVLLGGVTHSVVRNAHCPVLIVPRGTDRALAGLPTRSEATAT